jgi:hypothetical protein
VIAFRGERQSISSRIRSLTALAFLISRLNG